MEPEPEPKLRNFLAPAPAPKHCNLGTFFESKSQGGGAKVPRPPPCDRPCTGCPQINMKYKKILKMYVLQQKIIFLLNEWENILILKQKRTLLEGSAAPAAAGLDLINMA